MLWFWASTLCFDR